jgi:hypothetical protein
MTALQKENIKILRGKGESYAKIAAALGISENTVKSFCRRNKLGGNLSVSPLPDSAASPTFCKQCGKEIVQTPGRKVKVFCTYLCRMDWWKSNPDNISRKAVYSFSCPCCNTEFSAYGNKNRKFCSHACYVKARFGKAGDSGD